MNLNFDFIFFPKIIKRYNNERGFFDDDVNDFDSEEFKSEGFDMDELEQWDSKSFDMEDMEEFDVEEEDDDLYENYPDEDDDY